MKDLSEIVDPITGEITVFKPENAKARQSIYDAGIEHSARLGQWDEAERFAARKVAEMAAFVAWWDKATPDAGRPKNHNSADTISVSDAAQMTGYSSMQVSRWRRALTRPDEYATKLLEYWRAKALQQDIESKLERRGSRRGGVVSGAEAAMVKTSDLSTLTSRAMKFGTIMADPPWIYGNQSTRGATSDHYVGMTVDEIANLPIRELSADSAHLHLWTTNAFLFESKRIIESWGFEYRSCYVWVKPQIGMGNYWRVSHEFLLLGIRGSCPFADRALKSWGEFSRGKHSAKPDQVRSLVEKASPGPRLELFARRPAPGWVVWGNEIERTVFDSCVEELVL